MNLQNRTGKAKRLTSLSFVAFCLLLECGLAQRPAFEVVSIKVNKTGSNNASMGPKGGSLLAKNMTIRGLIMYAYRRPNSELLDAQVLGEPGWAKSEHFDIDAKPPDGARVVPGVQTRAMVQSMLEDFFQLKLHRETRELPVYNLTLHKSGPKLSQDQTPPEPRDAFISIGALGETQTTLPRGGLRLLNGPTTSILTGKAVSIATIVTLLQSKSERIIVDKTGFSGLIDVQMEFRTDAAQTPTVSNAAGNADSGPLSSDQFAASLFTAIQELGVKLSSGKAPLEVLVIDSVQRPVTN